MRIGVVGCGVVGSALLEAYHGSGYCECLGYDVDRNRTAGQTWEAPLDEVMGCDLVFACLPTPQREGSLALNLDEVEGFFNALPPESRKATVVLRSTVPVGTTRSLAERYLMPNLVHSPEFLTARTAVEDACNPRLNVVGTTGDEAGRAGQFRRGEGWAALMTLYQDRFPDVPVKVMTSDESELVKLGTNSFYAVKVAYFNELQQLARKLGCDYEVVRDAMVAEGRVGELHTLVPGPDGKCGFGGACLPKDLAQFVEHCRKGNMPNPMTTAAFVRNSQFDRGRAP